MALNGTQNYQKYWTAPLPPQAAAGAWTLAGWLRPGGAALSGPLFSLAANAYGGATGAGIAISLSNGLPRAVWQASNFSGGGVSAPSAVAANAWSHIAAVYLPGWAADTTKVLLYVNGALAATGAAGTSGAMANLATLFLGVAGGINSGSLLSNMALAEACAWNASLGAGEIAALASGQSPLAVRRAGLAHYFPLRGDLANLGSLRAGAAPNAAGVATVWTDHPSVSPPPRRNIATLWLSVVNAALAPGGAAIALTGARPSVSAGAGLAPGTGAWKLAGTEPGLCAGAAFAPGAAAWTMSDGVPEVSAGASVAPAAGSWRLAGAAPGLSAGASLTPDPAVLALASDAPGVSASACPRPAAAAWILAGAAPDVSADAGLAPGGGALLWAGGLPTLYVSVHVTLVPGRRAALAKDIRAAALARDLRAIALPHDVRTAALAKEN